MLVGLGGLSCLAVAVAPAVVDGVGSLWLGAMLRHQPGANVGSVALDWRSGRLNLGDVSWTAPGMRVDIGRLDLPLRTTSTGIASQALAEGEAAATADDVRIELPNVTLVIPHLKAEGTAPRGEDLGRIFDTKQPGTWEERLAKLTAHSIVAPEVKIAAVEADVAAKNGVFVIRNVALTDVDAGKIKALSADGGSVVGASDPDLKATIEVGKIAATNLDVPLAFRLATGSRTDEAAPLTTLYDSARISGIKYAETSPTPQSFGIGEMEASGVQTRPMLISVQDLAKTLNGTGPDVSGDERKRATAVLLDAFHSVKIGHFAVHDVAYAGIDLGKPVGLKVATMSVEDGEVLRMGKLLVEGVSINTSDFDMSFDRFRVEGLDQSVLGDALVLSGSSDAFETELLQHQAMRPNFREAAFDALRMQARAGDMDGNSADGSHYVFDIPSATMTMTQSDEKAVAAGSSHVQFVYDVSPTAPSLALKGLVQKGFGHIDVVSDTTIAYDPAKQTLRLDRLSVVGKGLASLVIDAAASNVSADMFGTDKDAKLEALQKAKLRSLRIAISNQTLVEKILPTLAAEAGMSVPAYKKDVKLKLRESVSEILGDDPTAKQLIAAGAAFIDNPKSLTLKMEAPNGLGVTEVTGAAEPKHLLSLMSVTARANQ